LRLNIWTMDLMITRLCLPVSASVRMPKVSS
jgi:hypothetical protein